MDSLRLNGRDLVSQLEAFRKTDLERHELAEVRAQNIPSFYPSFAICCPTKKAAACPTPPTLFPSRIELVSAWLRLTTRKELVKRVSELELQLERVTSDLEDQSSLRRDYKNRAEHAEKAIVGWTYASILYQSYQMKTSAVGRDRKSIADLDLGEAAIYSGSR